MLKPYSFQFQAPSPPSSVSSSRSASSTSTRSRLSFLSVSSSSTFSDISVSSLPSPPPSASPYSSSTGGSASAKTNAFFASPFPTRPPSPTPTPPLLSAFDENEKQITDTRSKEEKESKTSSFFSIPEIAIDISTPTLTTSTPVWAAALQSGGEPTPRPRDLEPDLFRSLLHPPPHSSPTPPPTTHLTPRTDTQPPQLQPPPLQETQTDPNEPSAGTIITSPYASAYTPVPTSPSPNSATTPKSQTTHGGTTLRLLKPLGHGAFSSVWLAEDLSPVPLVLTSRRSLRDLKRKASGKSPGLNVQPLSATGGGKIKSPQRSAGVNGLDGYSDDVMRKSSLRMLRRRVKGTRPIRSLDEFGSLTLTTPVATDFLPSSLSRASSTSSTSTTSSHAHKPLMISIEEPDSPSPSPSPSPLPSGRIATSAGGGLRRSPSVKGRLVAVKMTVRGGGEVGLSGWEGEEREKEKERTRVAFVREVEVLRHISHPNITPLLTHLSTPTHHVLVLPFLPGGDLLALVNSDYAWGRLRESVLKRIWVELCKAVGWMHGVGLVHRDIKLENILLTTPILTAPPPSSTSDTSGSAPTLDDLPPSPAPLIKLTDFGLSRFVDIRSDEERARDRKARRAARQRAGLSRRGAIREKSGSAATAAGHVEDRKQGEEDTEADEESDDEDEGPLLSTRCGSEAYAAPELVMGAPSPRATRSNKPASGIYDARETDAWACGVVLYALVGRRLPFGEGVQGGGIVREGEGGADAGRRRDGQGKMARRAWLMRIARGEYEWPEAGSVPNGGGSEKEGEEELIGPTLALSQGARRIAGRLLVRDPSRRARVQDLWGDTWMGGDEVVPPPLPPLPPYPIASSTDGRISPTWQLPDIDGEVVIDDEEADEDGGGQEGESEYDAYGAEQVVPMNEEELEIALREAAEEEVDDVEGWLVDQEGIGDIARREVV